MYYESLHLMKLGQFEVSDFGVIPVWQPNSCDLWFNASDNGLRVTYPRVCHWTRFFTGVFWLPGLRFYWQKHIDWLKRETNVRFRFEMEKNYQFWLLFDSCTGTKCHCIQGLQAFPPEMFNYLNTKATAVVVVSADSAQKRFLYSQNVDPYPWVISISGQRYWWFEIDDRDDHVGTPFLLNYNFCSPKSWKPLLYTYTSVWHLLNIRRCRSTRTLWWWLTEFYYM